MAEVHDCFTPTELSSWKTSDSPNAAQGVEGRPRGTFDLDGELPVNPDGGLKSFGHPIGAYGLRMLFECWPQLRGEAPDERQIDDRGDGPPPRADPQPRRGAGRVVSFVGVVGSEPSA